MAIPARDEAALIGAALSALAVQEAAPQFAVVLLLNNCVDRTAAVVKDIAGAMPYALHVYETTLDELHANAAFARRLAMNAASVLTHPDGVVLTTDADSQVDSRWIASIARCIDDGAEVVCGFVSPDFSDAPSLSFEALRQGAMEFEYSQRCAELTAILDPDPIDPWPNHMIETGANLAITTRALHALGGVPLVCPGEDQELVARARRAGFRVRHSFEPSVVTSSRIRGRAEGGWSEDLGARAAGGRQYCHPRLEPAVLLFKRLRLRAQLRTQFGRQPFFEAVRLLAPQAFDEIVTAPDFRSAWARLELHCGELQARRLAADELEASLEEVKRELGWAAASSGFGRQVDLIS